MTEVSLSRRGVRTPGIVALLPLMTVACSDPTIAVERDAGTAPVVTDDFEAGGDAWTVRALNCGNAATTSTSWHIGEDVSGNHVARLSEASMPVARCAHELEWQHSIDATRGATLEFKVKWTTPQKNNFWAVQCETCDPNIFLEQGGGAYAEFRTVKRPLPARNLGRLKFTFSAFAFGSDSGIVLDDVKVY